MALRKALTGRNAGGSFWGCQKFPRCKGTRRVEWTPAIRKLLNTAYLSGGEAGVLEKMIADLEGGYELSQRDQERVRDYGKRVQRRMSPREIQGGAPGLGRRSSRWYNPNNAGEEYPTDVEDDIRAVPPERTSTDSIRKMEVMLESHGYLTDQEWNWLLKIDQSASHSDHRKELSKKQQDVILDFYEKYRSRGGQE